MEDHDNLTHDLLTSAEVAARYGVDTREVLYATRRGMLPAVKIGWVWVYNVDLLPEKWPVKSKRKG